MVLLASMSLRRVGLLVMFASQAANFQGKWSEGSIVGAQFIGNNGTICKVEYDERDASKVFLITEHRTYTGTLSGISLCWDDGDTWHRIEACQLCTLTQPRLIGVRDP